MKALSSHHETIAHVHPQEAVIKQMDFLRIMHPTKRIIIVAFSSNISVWYDAATSTFNLGSGVGDGASAELTVIVGQEEMALIEPPDLLTDLCCPQVLFTMTRTSLSVVVQHLARMLDIQSGLSTLTPTLPLRCILSSRTLARS